MPSENQEKDNEETGGNKETNITEETKASSNEDALLVPGTPEHEKVVKQIQAEFEIAFKHTETKRNENLKRLKLYNNQKRDKSKVGDPLLFTVFNTVLASIYSDRLMSKAEPTEDGDIETAENCTGVMENDARVMEKDKLDYFWDWDTGFVGRGLVLQYGFNREKGKMCPIAENIDAITFLRDPDATSVNGDMQGHGAMLYGGREINLTKWQLENNKEYKNLKSLDKTKDTKNLTDTAKQEKDAAQGRDPSEKDKESLTENYQFNLLEWFTHIDGKKCVITLGNTRSLILRVKRLKENRWPINDRVLFPMSNDWDGVNIPDLIEDKQRGRAILINLGMKSALKDLYPKYLYNKKKITNPKDLDYSSDNDAVGVDGDPTNVIAPMEKSSFGNQVNLILNILDIAAQKAVAAPEVSQGVQPDKQRTLGETQLVAAGSDSRHSLAARIFGWSERQFWMNWYNQYKKGFLDEYDEKSIRINGALSYSFLKLKKENFISNTDPDFYIESTAIAEAERRGRLTEFSVFAQIALQDPNANRRYIMRKLGKLNRLSQADMLMMFPPTIDEYVSEEENSKINDNELPKINPTDDDIVHIEMHNKANDTAAKLAHMKAHKMMMIFKKQHPEFMAQFMQPQNPMDLSPVSAGAGSSGRMMPAMADKRLSPGKQMMMGAGSMDMNKEKSYA